MALNAEEASAVEHLNTFIEALEPTHQAALRWFHARKSSVVHWPELESDELIGQRLVTAAKGIYKPQGWDYALSVRQVLNGPYPDREPLTRPDGTWLYRYFQENPDPMLRDEQYTNLSLMACQRDRVPVGVLLQVASKPQVRYRVLGLALVARWDAGYFYLEGFNTDGVAHTGGLATEIEALSCESGLELSAEEQALASQHSILMAEFDARRRVIAAIVRRQGQGAFRQQLLLAYRGRCAVTGCDVEAALEAAHIVPYQGPHSNHLANGLLLRADVHTLLDLGYLAIDAARMTICLAPHLMATSYAFLADAPVRLPVDGYPRPSAAALEQHRAWTGL
jgi:putative restriction endonuclease